jgi:hypothetical protein
MVKSWPWRVNVSWLFGRVGCRDAFPAEGAADAKSGCLEQVTTDSGKA